MGTRDPLDGKSWNDVIREAIKEGREAALTGEAALASAWAQLAHAAILARQAERADRT